LAFQGRSLCLLNLHFVPSQCVTAVELNSLREQARHNRRKLESLRESFRVDRCKIQELEYKLGEQKCKFQAIKALKEKKAFKSQLAATKTSLEKGYSAMKKLMVRVVDI